MNMQKDLIRQGLNKYTRKAFLMLPPLNKPRILDIGCGSGCPTMELARLCNGEIIGVDIDQHSLDQLAGKVKREGFDHRVKIEKCLMFDISYPDESFDIIWVEGSIYRSGFERIILLRLTVVWGVSKLPDEGICMCCLRDIKQI